MGTVLAAARLTIKPQLFSICYQHTRHDEKIKTDLVTSEEALSLQGLAGHAEKAQVIVAALQHYPHGVCR